MVYHKPPPLPLSSFDPRYAELLKRGATEEFELLCSGPKEARGLRARIHTFRARARKHYGDAGKEHWEPLYLCTIYYVEDHKRGVFLRFAPRHKEFDNVLAQMPQIEPPALDVGKVDSLLDQLEVEQKSHEDLA